MFKYLSLLLLTVLIACSEEKQTVETPSDKELSSFHPEAYDWDTLKGIYRSHTEDADMFLKLDFSSPAHITGYSLFKGLKRNISGKVDIIGDSIYIRANEPGDLAYDGQFVLSYDPERVVMDGFWEMQDGSKRYDLHFKKHVYDFDFEYGDPMAKSNVSDYLSALTGRNGELYFNMDGSVRMEYYPIVDSGQFSQLEIFRGGWTFEKGKLFVDWKSNHVFNQKRTPVQVFMSEYGVDSIQIEDRFYFPFYW